MNGQKGFFSEEAPCGSTGFFTEKQALPELSQERKIQVRMEENRRNVRVRLIVEGKVQGVWFRESTRREASHLGVFGWVRNRPDGKVEVLAEGPEESVRSLVAWCHHGPPAARVHKVQEYEEAWTGEFDSFDVAYAGGIW